MPGISSGLANTNDYVLGRGTVYFSSVDANGFPKEFRDLGNCPSFAISTESETLEHKSSRAGLKVIDKKVDVSRTVGVKFTLDEAANFDNLALFLSGAPTQITQGSGTIAPNGTTEGNLRLSAATLGVYPAEGRWYDIYDNAPATTGFAYPPANTAKRVVDISAVTVKSINGATTYVLGTDYTLDLKWGRIYILAGSQFTTAQEIAITFTKSAKTIDQVSGLTLSNILGALKFIQLNAANSSVESEWQFHAVTLSADGDLNLLSDDVATMGFSGSVEARAAVDPVAPTVRVRYYA